MSTLTQDQIRTLDQTRQRLVQLTQSLGSLAASINQSDPLPPWTSLQSQASIISKNLASVSQQLSQHQDFLSSVVAYPGPNFPGRTQSAMLGQLVRTKLDPRVDDWVARGRTVGTAAAARKDPIANASTLNEQQLDDLWGWAPIEANQEARKREWGGSFTLEEREMGIKNVVTGLKRRLDEEEEEYEDDEDEDGDEEGDGEGEAKGEPDGDEMEIVGVHRKSGAAGVEFDISQESSHVPSKPISPALPLDDVFRFTMIGAKPKSK